MNKKKQSITPTDLTRSVQITIMGITIRVHYTIHEPSYVEWELRSAQQKMENLSEKHYPIKEMQLLSVLLRTHYSQFIEAVIRESAFYQSYAESQGRDDYIPPLDAFSVFNDEDVPF
jgi:hypothetical protein